jgi:hypothetical protein
MPPAVKTAPKPAPSTGAQPPAAAAKTGANAKAAKTSAVSLAGTWSGTATVPLGDSTIVVPVTYTFTESAGVIAGTGVVPGQATGPISNVLRDGTRLQFRVTVNPDNRMLDHDGTIAADGSVQGMVLMGGLPVAKFTIAKGKPASPPTPIRK